MKILIPTSITLDEEKLGLEPWRYRAALQPPQNLLPRKIPMPKFLIA